VEPGQPGLGVTFPARFSSVPVRTVAGMTSPSVARLEEMIGQATVDCHNDSEQACGLFTVIEEALAVPFEATVLGVSVNVTAVDLTVDDQIVGLVHRDGTGSASRCWICRCRTRRRSGRSGSRPTGAGRTPSDGRDTT